MKTKNLNEIIYNHQVAYGIYDAIRNDFKILQLKKFNSHDKDVEFLQMNSFKWRKVKARLTS